jgi:hypothetical protein
MIILNNNHSRTSREFVSTYGAEATVINWYSDYEEVSRFIDTYGLEPSGFPAIVDEDTKVMVIEPDTPVDLVYAIIEYIADQKQQELRSTCENEIISGINHDALGSLHEYGTTPTDQVNMSASVTAAKIYGAVAGPYMLWCANGNGQWARREHTPAQIEAIGLAIMASVRESQNTFEAKLIELASASTIEEMEAVEWDEQ